MQCMHRFSCKLAKSVSVKAVWADIPCKTIRRSALVSHMESTCTSHKQAIQMAVSLKASKTDGGIEGALDSVVSAQHKAFTGALKCMYFLIKGKLHTQQILVHY